MTPADKLKEAIVDIEAEMEVRVGQLEAEGRALEGARLRQRTTFDLEMMRELGYCTGIENYSRHLSRREAGSRPWTLLDYFPPDWLLVVDESHMTIPQVVGMYKNDRTRKEILVDFGFRLPSALDNRPLTFEEFEATVHQAVYMSATPGPVRARAQRDGSSSSSSGRPASSTRAITVRPTEGQIDDLLEEIRVRAERGERALVTTLTKKMAEDLTDYLKELGVKVQYLHSEVDTLERVAILRDLRLGVFDVLVGINLLREGIDLPEVTLVAILDADKEGFLRSAWSLIQMIGRAARNIGGEVVMYADRDHRIDAGRHRRDRPPAGDPGRPTTLEHGIEPTTIVKGIHDLNQRLRAVAESTVVYTSERGGEFTEADRAQGRGARRADGGRDARARPRSSSSSAPPRSATRSSRSACASSSRTPRSSSGGPPSGRRREDRGLTGAADRARGRRAADAAALAPVDGGHERRRSCRPTRSRPATSTASRRARHRREHRRRLAARHPRRARRRRRHAQARWLDRPTWDRTRHPEHPQADGPATGSPPLAYHRGRGARARRNRVWTDVIRCGSA